MHTERITALQSLLDMFVDLTNLPIGLYEVENGIVNDSPIFSNSSLDNFEEHCSLIQSFPGGRKACEADQCNRAKQGIQKREEHLSICHAGIFNQIVPVKVKNQVKAVLLYGEMLIDTEEHLNRSFLKHKQVVQELQLNEEEAQSLKLALDDVKKMSLTKLASLKEDISKVVQWFYILLEREEELSQQTLRVRHEIQLRLQALVAHAAILSKTISRMTPEQAQSRSDLLLNSARAFETVMNNLGGYIEEYYFTKVSLLPLIQEIQKLYEAEANNRNIDIYVDLKDVDKRPPIIECSRHHIQHTFSNLLQNAVKYSFRGNSKRRRYVSIRGKSTKDYYQITISNYGVGISQYEIENELIFQEGYQGQLTQGEYRTGSGKGLHIVKKIIEDHQGLMEVTSELLASDSNSPEGEPHHTRFHVYLPFKRNEANTHE